jgi:hypothetical protein
MAESDRKCPHCGVYPGQIHNLDCPNRTLTLDDFLKGEPKQPDIVRPLAGIDDNDEESD